MTHPLDDPASLSLDRSGMFGHIRDLGPQLSAAWEQSAGLPIPPAASRATSVVLAGIGGSATAADYFAAISANHASIPIAVVRGPSLPNYVSERTLVVACSYSGNTEETLAAYDDAWKRGAAIFVIARGGALVERAAADGVPVHLISYDASPRATTVHTLAPLLRLGAALGLVTVDDHAISAAARAHTEFIEAGLVPEQPQATNGAKQLAVSLHGRVPLVIGAEHLIPAASRFKNQLAENGKALGATDSLPEAAHNLVVGLETAAGAGKSLSLVTLESHGLYAARTQARFDVVTSLFEAAGVPVRRIDIGGETILEQLLLATAWGDYVSCYLALLNGVDPTPVPQIERYRAAMARLP